MQVDLGVDRRVQQQHPRPAREEAGVRGADQRPVRDAEVAELLVADRLRAAGPGPARCPRCSGAAAAPGCAAGRPRPKSRLARIQAASSVRPGRGSAAGKSAGPQSSRPLAPTPRGSQPTKSKRWVAIASAGGGAVRTKSTPEPPGPPGLAKSEPIRRAGSAAGLRISARSIVRPCGARVVQRHRRGRALEAAVAVGPVEHRDRRVHLRGGRGRRGRRRRGAGPAGEQAGQQAHGEQAGGGQPAGAVSSCGHGSLLRYGRYGLGWCRVGKRGRPRRGAAGRGNAIGTRAHLPTRYADDGGRAARPASGESLNRPPTRPRRPVPVSGRGAAGSEEVRGAAPHGAAGGAAWTAPSRWRTW